MFLKLIEVFFTVVAPVFITISLGYFSKRPLKLEARSLSRTAYYFLVPAFVFEVIRKVKIPGGEVLGIVGHAVVTHAVVAAAAFLLAHLLGRSLKRKVAFLMIAVFGNVGNFGLTLLDFRYGAVGLEFGSVVFLSINIFAFLVCVSAASSVSGGSSISGAFKTVLLTPVVVAIWPAFIVNLFEVPLPLILTRVTGLLSQAMIPVMLFTLGVQLRDVPKLRPGGDMFLISGIRLIAAPALAFLLLPLFGLSGIQGAASVVQAGMPAAVLTSIFALEFNCDPDFVTPTVLLSTLLSLFSLTLLFTWL